MKKKITLFVVLILLLLLSLNLISCTDPCESEEAQDYVKSYAITFEEFKDIFDLAESTSRIALSPVISDMQEVKRELNRLELPENCEKYDDMQEYSVETMEKAIDAFMKFAQQEDEYEVMNIIESVKTRFEYIENWIEETEESFKY